MTGQKEKCITAIVLITKWTKWKGCVFFRDIVRKKMNICPTIQITVVMSKGKTTLLIKNAYKI